MSNYSRGANFERRVAREMLKQGAVSVTCSRGSHGAADVVALFPQCGYAIQCQINKYFEPGKIEAVKEIARQCPYMKAMLAWREGRKPEIQEVQNVET